MDKELGHIYYCTRQELNQSVGIILTFKRVKGSNKQDYLMALDHVKHWLEKGKYFLGDSLEALDTLYGKNS